MFSHNFLFSANAAYKQLDTDKKFLEDQLKSCRKNVRSYPIENVGSIESGPSESRLSVCTDQSENAVQDRRDSCPKIKTRRKEINILEELDHEFNQQKEKLTLEGEDNQMTKKAVSSRLPINKSAVRGFRKTEVHSVMCLFFSLLHVTIDKGKTILST